MDCCEGLRITGMTALLVCAEKELQRQSPALEPAEAVSPEEVALLNEYAIETPTATVAAVDAATPTLVDDNTLGLRTHEQLVVQIVGVETHLRYDGTIKYLFYIRSLQY